MLNKELVQEQAIWLIEQYKPKMGGRLDGTTMDTYFVPARALMTGKPASRPGCACHYKAYAAMTNNMFGQYEAEIQLVAYPPKTKTRVKTTKS